MRKGILVVLLLLPFLVACGKSEEQLSGNHNISIEESADTAKTDLDKTTDHLKMKMGDRFNVDAEIEYPQTNFQNIYDYKAQSNDFNFSSVLNALHMSDADLVNMDVGLYQRDGYSLQISKGISGSIAYGSDYAEHIREYSAEYASAHKDIAELGENRELNFLSRKKAIDEIISLLHQLQIDNAYVTKIYSLPIEYQKIRENEELQDGTIDSDDVLADRWDGIGDCYQIELGEQLSEIPIYQSNYVCSDGTICNGSKITAFITKDGIVKLVIPNQYVTTETIDNSKQIMEPEKVVQNLNDQFEELITSESYTASSMKLIYFPELFNKNKNEFHMIPVWKIDLKSNNQEENELEYLFDARTGQELEL